MSAEIFDFKSAKAAYEALILARETKSELEGHKQIHNLHVKMIDDGIARMRDDMREGFRHADRHLTEASTQSNADIKELRQLIAANTKSIDLWLKGIGGGVVAIIVGAVSVAFKFLAG